MGSQNKYMKKLQCEKCGLFKGKDKSHLCNNSVWNKGKKGVQIAWNKGVKMSQKTKDKLSKARKGTKQLNLQGVKNGMFGKKPWNKGIKTGKPSAMSGKKHTIETRLKISSKAKQLVAEGRHHFWKGGIMKINAKIRCSIEYKLWRESVFKRDNFTCVWCGHTGHLNADHIKPFALYPELRFAIDNGRTLCVPCHKTTNTFGGRIKK